jgi:uncharacterized protein
MLTADLVDARKRDGELLLRKLDKEGRAEGLAIGAALLDAARDLVGSRREELDEAWNAATSDGTTKRFKLAAGLRKLVADACTFEAETALDPVELRRIVFTHASEIRRALAEGEPFDRTVVLDEAARVLGTTPDVVERAMFADLKGEHRLRAAPTLSPESVVEAWELGQAQAVLLTAVRITCTIASASPGLLRAFFAKLKFHQLLFTTERIDDGGWKIVIDGPYSMFDSVTKYGLRLACVLPALRALEKWSLVADIQWGKRREKLVFHLTNESAEGFASRERLADDGLHVSDEVRELAEGIEALDAGWRARPATVLLDVPGHGICIPDLELTHSDHARPVYVEVLGYWSRDAVFRRVELAERGLRERVIFAASSRLRVSEKVLDKSLAAALYVYKGKMSPRAIITLATPSEPPEKQKKSAKAARKVR